MYNYQSEFTQFMNDYLEKNPEVAEGRLTNRGLLWDVTLKDEEQNNFDAAELPKPAYTYQTSADWLQWRYRRGVLRLSWRNTCMP